MTQIDNLISKYNGCINWITYYQERGTRDDAPKHLAALATEQREVALQIVVMLIRQHQLTTDDVDQLMFAERVADVEQVAHEA